MKAKDIIRSIMNRTGTTITALAKGAGLAWPSVSKSVKAERPALDIVVRYLHMMGYDLYAVPSDLHVDQIDDRAIKIETNE